ncbi:MAG TPA: DUF3780 domain-containing protein [Spirochaetales bacterium]|nr:DUF3780 domain-containing protein [Spirochaetales bacterium]
MSVPRSSKIGFGFDPEKSTHFFVARIPDSRSEDASVRLAEYFEWAGTLPNPETLELTDKDLRAIISKQKFDEVADAVRSEFNRRLASKGYAAGRWASKGSTPLERSFGKELSLLFWAVEDAEISSVHDAVQNWLGLAPEERWWLYTMTNAATGQAIAGRNKGWRKAVRYALTENPINESIIRKRPHFEELSLFSDVD